MNFDFSQLIVKKIKKRKCVITSLIMLFCSMQVEECFF